VVADELPIVRKGICAVLEEHKDFRLVGEADNGLEAIRLVERLQPDVIILDVLMPSLNGLDALPVLQLRSPRTRVVVYTRVDDEAMVLQAIKHGAIAYILKRCAVAEFVKGIREAVAGRRFLCPDLWERAIESYFEKAQSSPEGLHETLTPRE